MAYNDFLLRFRSLSTDALQAKQTALEAQESMFSQQAMGSKSFQRDNRLLQDQLNAIAFVLRERGVTVVIPATINSNIGITNFEAVQ